MAEDPDWLRWKALAAVVAVPLGFGAAVGFVYTTTQYWVGHNWAGLSPDAIFQGLCTLVVGVGAMVGITYQVRKSAENARAEMIEIRREESRMRVNEFYRVLSDAIDWARDTRDELKSALKHFNETGQFSERTLSVPKAWLPALSTLADIETVMFYLRPFFHSSIPTSHFDIQLMNIWMRKKAVLEAIDKGGRINHVEDIKPILSALEDLVAHGDPALREMRMIMFVPTLP